MSKRRRPSDPAPGEAMQREHEHLHYNAFCAFECISVFRSVLDKLGGKGPVFSVIIGLGHISKDSATSVRTTHIYLAVIQSSLCPLEHN